MAIQPLLGNNNKQKKINRNKKESRSARTQKHKIPNNLTVCLSKSVCHL